MLQIKVTVHPDNSISAEDNGRGILQTSSSEKDSTLRLFLLSFTQVGFDNKSSIKLQGFTMLDVSVVNALFCKTVTEQRVMAKSTRSGLERGKNRSEDERKQVLQKLLLLPLWPDDMIFETTTYNFDTLRDRLQETAFLGKNLKITLVDERELTPVS